MTASELAEHAGYLGDEAKLKSYGDALEAVVADGREVVLDLGAGSGILGLLAARVGARRVYAVDSGPIVGAAAEVAARSAIRSGGSSTTRVCSSTSPTCDAGISPRAAF